MDWINCNLCNLQPCDEKERLFMITSCGHIICDLCLSQAESRDKCRVCSEQCQLIKLSSNMKPEIGLFFQEPSDLYRKQQTQMKRLLDFQRNHRTRLVSYHRKMLSRCKEIEKQYKHAVERIQALEKENIKLKEMLNSGVVEGGDYGVIGGGSHPHEQFQRVIAASAVRNSPQGSQVQPAARFLNGRLTLMKGKMGSPACRISPAARQTSHPQNMKGGGYHYPSQAAPTNDMASPMFTSPEVSRITSPYSRNVVNGGRYYGREASPLQHVGSHVGSQSMTYSQNKKMTGPPHVMQSPNPIFFSHEGQGGNMNAYPRY